ncbi:MAG: aldo/keto reductase [Gammaproteobacteria bacterium]|nr:aldo/keto reductase [Gammaproteobacteria bacterium]
MSQLVLGTAQWGHAYGVTNTTGRLEDAEISALVDASLQAGISRVDTARGYGDAEARLRPFSRDFQVTTKIGGGDDAGDQVSASLADLGVHLLDAVLIHDWDTLDDVSRMAAVRGLSGLLDDGVASRVGVSVYDAAGLEVAVEMFDAAGVRLQEVQVPANVLDRRLDESGALMDLSESGAHVVVRSVFLQGILLAPGGGLADHPDVVNFRDSIERPSSALEACLGHVRGLPWATHVVVGATSARELSEIVTAWQSCSPGLREASLASSDLDLIDPRRW